MLAGDWMSKNVATLTEDTSMIKAARVMKERKIRRLPVVDKDGRLSGIVSERDIKSASPSQATSLDVYELTHLLSEIKVKDIMTAKPLRIRPSDTVERAAQILRDNKVGGLPVVDDKDQVVGIITDTDIFRLYTMLSGVDLGGVQLGLRLSSKEGTLKEVMDELRARHVRVISLLSRQDGEEDGTRDVYIRIHDLPLETARQLQDYLEGKKLLLYWTKD